jgi:hypothetical protein
MFKIRIWRVTGKGESSEPEQSATEPEYNGNELHVLQKVSEGYPKILNFPSLTNVLFLFLVYYQ